DLAELEIVAPGLEQRMVRAAVYALASCNACALEATPRGTATRAIRHAPRPIDVTPRVRVSASPAPSRDGERARPPSPHPTHIHPRTTRPFDTVDDESAVRFKPASSPPPAGSLDDDLDPARTRTVTDPAQRMRQLVDPPHDDLAAAEPRSATT